MYADHPAVEFQKFQVKVMIAGIGTQCQSILCKPVPTQHAPHVRLKNGSVQHSDFFAGRLVGAFFLFNDDDVVAVVYSIGTTYIYSSIYYTVLLLVLLLVLLVVVLDDDDPRW